MMRLRMISLLAGLLAVWAGAPGLRAEAAKDAPDFKEVYDLIRAHLAGVTEADLNRAAVQGLVSALGPKVSLVTNGATAQATAGASLVGKSSLFEDSIAYIRIGKVEAGLSKAFTDACGKVAGTNKLKGVVLDLRFADGNDYGAAAAVADVFVSKERPLLNWGNGVARSKAKEKAMTQPVAVLVNHQTSGAAEALAAVLRETGTGLILGTNTAGQAMIAQEFPLKDGERLRIATAPVQLGDGSALSAQGIKPDIIVEVSARDERAYYADAFQAIPKPSLLASGGVASTNQGGNTNRMSRRNRFNEAELVRERKEGFGTNLDLPTGKDDGPEESVVQDPVLARALDVLKGLAVVRESRS